MKILSLLRHAKSSWDDTVQRDFDRPLNARGEKAAQRMGQYLAEQKLEFDYVIASPAVRILETVAGVNRGLGRDLGPVYDRRIYMASAASLFDLLAETPEEVQHLLLIGHNPGLEDLLLLSTIGDPSDLRADAEHKYPTAAYARIHLPINRWADIEERIEGRVEAFVRPRQLDDSLGPDEDS